MRKRLCNSIIGVWTVATLFFTVAACGGELEWLKTGRFRWNVQGPLAEPMQRPDELIYSVKDPTVVRFADKWHVFCTIRAKNRSHQVEYICFDDWEKIANAKREILTLTDGYFCAPQVFYFQPHKKWYMILQVADQSRKPSLQPACSTTDDINSPGSWSKPVLLFESQPENIAMWIDFWVICDNENAHLFFTSLDGKMWRSQTSLADFPHRWNRPKVVLEGDIFEASHTYKLKGAEKYLTIIEAEDKPMQRRYYKAYTADRLDGAWEALATTKESPFAGPANVYDKAAHWTDSFSHGELLRAGFDQRLDVDPNNLRFVFQGVLDENKRGKPYGEIPWQLGLLEGTAE